MTLLRICLLLGINQLFTIQKTFAQVRFEDRTECVLPNNGIGVCLKLEDCPEHSHHEVGPKKTCFYRLTERYVCCPEPRPSAEACTDIYPFVVVNGEFTDYGEFPHMLAIGWKSSQRGVYDYKCGGVLVSRYFGLTAAHCAYNNNLQPMVVLAGGVSLSNKSAQIVNVKRVIQHPDYHPDFNYNDIAIIELKTPIDEKIACLWTHYTIPETTNLAAIGYGNTKFGGRSSDNLLKAYVHFISNEKCQEFYGNDEKIPNGIIKSQLCAHDPINRRDTCQGDSGGPLVMYEITVHPPHNVWRPYVVGITSFGLDCGGKTPGVYTRVSEYIEWIESVIWS